MKTDITVSMITKNAEKTIEKSLRSVCDWVDKIVIIDDYSIDKTVKIAKKYQSTVYQNTYQGEGNQRNFGLKKIVTKWTLTLDADEVIADKVKEEILNKVKSPFFSGYRIPFQSYFFHQKLNYGGENYQKMVLFRTNEGFCTKDEVHAVYKIKTGKIGQLKNKIDHYSYRSLPQLFIKFNNYAIREAKQKKSRGEKSSFKKIFLYPPHLFWARFIKDKGYKDGLFRIPLDLGFAYMEFVTYVKLLFMTL